jgi:hypothetical protein
MPRATTKGVLWSTDVGLVGLGWFLHVVPFRCSSVTHSCGTISSKAEIQIFYSVRAHLVYKSFTYSSTCITKNLPLHADSNRTLYTQLGMRDWNGREVWQLRSAKTIDTLMEFRAWGPPKPDDPWLGKVPRSRRQPSVPAGGGGPVPNETLWLVVIHRRRYQPSGPIRVGSDVVLRGLVAKGMNGKAAVCVSLPDSSAGRIVVQFADTDGFDKVVKVKPGNGMYE